MKLKNFFPINEQASTGQTLSINSPTGVTITFNDITNRSGVYEIFKQISGLSIKPNNFDVNQSDKNRYISGTKESIDRFIALYNQKYPNQMANLNITLPTSSSKSTNSSGENQPSQGDQILTKALMSAFESPTNMKEQINRIKNLINVI